MKIRSLGLLSQFGSLRPPQGAGHFYNPAELASNLQHLQHLHSVQQQIAAAAAASGYWASVNVGGKGRESSTESPAGTWRYESSPSSLSVKPFASAAAANSSGPTAKSPPPLHHLSGKRKRTDSDAEDAERRSSPASFNHEGKSCKRDLREREKKRA